jgi:hypothetical protein
MKYENQYKMLSINTIFKNLKIINMRMTSKLEILNQ